MSDKGFIIAIDGYSSCGKSTFARAIANRLGYIFIDTGAMYRTITLEAMRRGAIVDGQLVDTAAIEEIARSTELSFKVNKSGGMSEIYIGDECVDHLIRTVEVSNCVSQVSGIEVVRAQLVAAQQAMGDMGGVVMDGRDIGTVVFPEAQIKLFMTADPRIRAQRRYDELCAKGDDVSLEQIEENIVARDHADETRKISPLQRAADAIVLDNSTMSIAEQMEWFMEIYNKKRGATE